MLTPDGPFWELVKAEVRATWCGELRWLWRALALVFTLIIVFVPTHDLGLLEVYLTPGWLFLTVTPVVLGSDLLSLAFRENPQPQRIWPFRAIVARAVGRFMPWTILSAAMHYAWLSRFSSVFGIGASPTDGGARGDALGVFAILLHMPSVSLLAFTMAACVSLALRRPKRLLVTGLIQSLLSVGAFALYARVTEVTVLPPSAIAALTLNPLHHLMVGLYNWIRAVIGIPPRVTMADPGWVYMLFPVLTTGVALLLWTWIRAVVEARSRRHPYQVAATGAGEYDAVPEAEP